MGVVLQNPLGVRDAHLAQHVRGVAAGLLLGLAGMEADGLHHLPVNAASPAHPYTQGLIASVPKLGAGVKVLPSIPGSVPDLASMPKGCRFAPRCKYATSRLQTRQSLRC